MADHPTSLEAFQRIRGHLASIRELLAYLDPQRTGAPPEVMLANLPERQRAVVELMISTSLTYRQIGERLFVAEDTVKTHVRRVFRAFGVQSRSELAQRLRDVPKPPGSPPEPPVVRRSVVTMSDQAACRYDPDAQFADDPAGRQAAKRKCKRCPLQKPCLVDAMVGHITAGVWGGMTANQRARLRNANPDVKDWRAFLDQHS